MNQYSTAMFSDAELREIRERFYYVDTDRRGNSRLFFDNAGGSLRLKKAEEAFLAADSMPDASEHSNTLAKELAALEEDAKDAVKHILFGAKTGVLFPGYTASQIAMEVIRTILENTRGTNIVTTLLEHPSVFDACERGAGNHGMELRVAGVNVSTGGVDADAILSLVDKDTALICCMAASNISGSIYDTAAICREARKINPDVFIFVDAVQHAPHGLLDPEGWGADAVSFAPYKFFGTRGLGLAWLSDRIASFDHHRLLGKAADDWEIGSPATGQFASVREIIRYVSFLGQKTAPAGAGKREVFAEGMARIAGHERGLLCAMLEGCGGLEGLRQMEGVTVRMDGKDLTKRDLILGIEFDRLPCEQAVREYESRFIITFERAKTSIYSRRMVEAFGSAGMVRLSPLHVNTEDEIARFLEVTKEIAAL